MINEKNMEQCHCYHTQVVRRYTYHPITGRPIGHDNTVGVCWGTRECDQCTCGGDETKCDFYPEVRKKAKNKPEKIVTNADRIRAMTDEELADFIVESDAKIKGTCHTGRCGEDETCVGCALKWLKQPSNK